MQTRNTFSWIKEEITRSISVSLMIYIITRAPVSNAYPIFAQQSYENPREATGRIVCANCHLANKPVDIEVPQAVLPDTVFEAVVRIPYDLQLKQVLANGKKGALNVGAILILPEGFESKKLYSLNIERFNSPYYTFFDDPAKTAKPMVTELLRIRGFGWSFQREERIISRLANHKYENCSFNLFSFLYIVVLSQPVAV